jgi:hypothetical protein
MSLLLKKSWTIYLLKSSSSCDTLSIEFILKIINNIKVNEIKDLNSLRIILISGKILLIVEKKTFILFEKKVKSKSYVIGLGKGDLKGIFSVFSKYKIECSKVEFKGFELSWLLSEYLKRVEDFSSKNVIELSYQAPNSIEGITDICFTVPYSFISTESLKDYVLSNAEINLESLILQYVGSSCFLISFQGKIKFYDEKEIKVVLTNILEMQENKLV